MDDHDSTPTSGDSEADDRQVDLNHRGREGADTGSAQTTATSARRRSFLKALSVPSLAAGLAGCPLAGDGSSGDDDDDATTVDSGDGAAFDETIKFGDTYRMETVMRDSNGATMHLTGRFHGDDHYLRMETGDGVLESYAVDGDTYYVTDVECFEYPGTIDSPDEATSEEVGDPPADYPALRRTGTQSIDGREMVVFTLPAADLPGYDGDLTYYVDAETRYMRRLEGEFGTVDYRSWGDVDPIDVPDLDCRQPG